MGQLDRGYRWKRFGIGGTIAAACLAGIERGCKTVETVHAVDYVTHLNESPLLQSVQHVAGTPSGIGFLLVTVILLGGWSLRLRHERNVLRERTREQRQIAPANHEPARRASDVGIVEGLPLTMRASEKISSKGKRPSTRRVRTIIAEHEETQRTTVTLVEEIDERPHRAT